ncbi:hypothetical protein MTR_0181s0040 [Medicago truncatula]|uniref:Reverse transcriptase zinc-binding domain-containing protein n=1 Tax=Medicago truncatula TaxID=3880 RepID=A0A072TGY5_MEDTR|nr:hypothetical protein MTR_0181s0040 [Medicago truncatula]
MSLDKEGLWYRVLKARYGEEGGRLREGAQVFFMVANEITHSWGCRVGGWKLDHLPNRWGWLLDPISGYSVKGTYNFLTTTDEPIARGSFDDVWHKNVPLKHDDNRCVEGCGCEETAGHLFLGCTTFCSVWYHIFHWLDINFVAPEAIGEHFLQFGHFSGLPRLTYPFLKLI